MTSTLSSLLTSRSCRPRLNRTSNIGRSSPSDQQFVDAESDWIKEVQTLDLLLNTAEERFSATLYEIERHLSGLGRLFREEARKLLDLRSVALTSADSGTLQTDAGEPFKNSNAESRDPRRHRTTAGNKEGAGTRGEADDLQS
jgi:ribosome assembly protein YihI (activator of Der GTPase)